MESTAIRPCGCASLAIDQCVRDGDRANPFLLTLVARLGRDQH